MKKITGIIAACSFMALTALGQSEDCSGEPSMIGQTMPINTLVTPMADDFAMGGAGCVTFDTTNCGFQDGYDSVVCFTPRNDCEVVYQVATGSANVAIHIFSGDCMEPVSCFRSERTDTMFSIFLDRGVQYCFVAERCGAVNMNVFIGEAGGSDCGVFLNPDTAFVFCMDVLDAWNQDRLSPCTGLDHYTVLDMVAWLNGSCPCDFPLDD